MAQRKPWSAQQDQFIRKKVQINSKVSDKQKLKWGDIAQQLNKLFPQSHRSGKQCRQRWHNQLDPNILHSQWSFEQQKKLFKLQKDLGNRWAEIASQIKGRTDNNVKNYFYSTLRKSLRKINTFISLNRVQLKAAKQFKQSSLSKLLAVADHKFDKKINIKKDTAQNEAKQIKNMLIEITHLQVNDQKSKSLFMGLVKKFQQWNKCCKKKKGKKKQQIQIGQQQKSSNQDQQQLSEEEQINEPKRQLNSSNNLRNSGLNRSRSRNLKPQIKRNNSNLSKHSNQQKPVKKPNKQQKKLIKVQKRYPKRQIKSTLPQISQINKKPNSSQKISNGSASRFIELSRSSLDLGKYKRNSQNSQQLDHSSNLFKSFIMNDQPQSPQKPSEKGEKGQWKNRVTRSNSNFSFLNMIKQVSLQHRQSVQSGIDGLLHEEDYNGLFPMNMLRKESSRRDLPMIKDQSFMGFGGLDSSLRFEPQITKLRSWKKDSSNFEHDYEFGNSQLI